MSRKKGNKSTATADDAPTEPTTIKLTPEQKQWLTSLYPKFLEEKGTRGRKVLPNAQKWVTDKVIPEFMSKWHSNLTGEEHTDLFDRANYNFRRQFVGGANPKVVEEALAEFVEANPDKDDIGNRRVFVCDMFKKLPAETQAEWKRKADEAREARAVAAAAPLTGEAKTKYIGSFLSRVNAIFKEAEQKARIYSIAHLAVAKDSEGPDTLVINSLGCPGVKDYKTTTEHNESAARFGEFLRDNLNQTVLGTKPLAAVAPDSDGRPRMPELPPNITLKHGRRMVRTAGSAYWQYAGGQLPVPWTAISKDLHKWVSKDRLPSKPMASGAVARLIDPGEMTLEETLFWVNHFGLFQRGEPDREARCFQFEQVYATLDHQFPSDAQHISKEKVRHGHSDVYLVKYGGEFISKPQTLSKIHYPRDTWEYVLYDANNVTEVWLGLPSGAPRPIIILIPDRELEVYESWFGSLAPEDSHILEMVRGVIKEVNAMEALLPLLADTQLWTETDGKPALVPQVLPQSPPSDARIDSFVSKFSFWMSRSYSGPTDAALPCGTSAELEIWQKKMRTGPLYHERSKTYLGGKWGVVWIIRALLVFAANAGAACGKLEAPIPIPEDYEEDRVGRGDWKRSLTWIHEWHEALIACVNTLKQTFDQRVLPAMASEQSGSESGPGRERDSTFDPDFDNIMNLPSSSARGVSMLATRPKLKRKAKTGVSYATDYSDGENHVSGGEALGDEEEDSETEGTVSRSAGKKAQTKPVVDLLEVPKRSPVSFESRPYIFGPEPEPGPVAPFEGNAKELTGEANAFVARFNKALQSYLDTRYAAGHPYSSRMMRQVDERLANVEDSRRPLLACIFAQRGSWLKAEKLWPRVYEDYLAFWNLFREGTRVLVAIPQVKQIHPGPAATRLSNRTREIKAYTWAARCLLEQFQTASHLSLIWANRLEDAWEEISIDSPLEELESLVSGIRDWRRDFGRVMADRRDYRRAVFAKYQVELYVKEFKDCWFTHGNPTKAGLTPEAKGLVKHIAHMESCITENDDDEMGDDLRFEAATPPPGHAPLPTDEEEEEEEEEEEDGVPSAMEVDPLTADGGGDQPSISGGRAKAASVASGPNAAAIHRSSVAAHAEPDKSAESVPPVQNTPKSSPQRTVRAVDPANAPPVASSPGIQVPADKVPGSASNSPSGAPQDLEEDPTQRPTSESAEDSAEGDPNPIQETHQGRNQGTTSAGPQGIPSTDKSENANGSKGGRGKAPVNATGSKGGKGKAPANANGSKGGKGAARTWSQRAALEPPKTRSKGNASAEDDMGPKRQRRMPARK